MEFYSAFLLVQKTEIHNIKPLSEVEIYRYLQDLSNWQIKDNKLSYTHKFQNFVEAINFVNCLVTPAETANHHPDIAISYNQVTINLTTHDVGGLTALDFELATTISQLIKTWKSDKKCQL
ncbi:MAG: 4a-hydroxytetrahydrobiopterin dehydratase [Okeania sp. SIO3B5]|uniref:4a-hydroxytetrahydrobiopterin dehydratase n=1 Tax=Okeania sp. SIO3B5 TaxID=2607811 RepID=UPI001400D534|nr:4a-hydroxytetrahydrobiopterin dehydratase [Okeania sp. SIO3B5]NEO57727.1 4a-hydroxytetrahydrobiopterin dehydratase [Okeania sp. SIO3B5]